MNYMIPIMSACLVFPLIAALFTAPYVLLQYHKYGSIPTLRVIVVYSFILYLIAAYFLVILPLPPLSEVAKMTGPRVQLLPFQFVADFLNNTSLILTDPSTYLTALKEPYLYQWLYNIILTLPFGIYLHYYFNCSFKKTVLYTFLFSLFFELTQLTGLYFIYPRPYRLFDVDDLFLNTVGGMIGFVVTPLIERILPTREELDEIAFEKGKKISFTRRLTAFALDGFLFFIYSIIATSGISFWYDLKQIPVFITTLILFVFYYCIIPYINDSSTLGKQFLKMKIVTFDEKKPRFYQLCLRNFLLYFVLFALPSYLIKGVLLLQDLFHYPRVLLFYLLLGVLLFSILCSLFIFARVAIRKKFLFYEKWSKTKNMSTISHKERQSCDILNVEES